MRVLRSPLVEHTIRQHVSTVSTALALLIREGGRLNPRLRPDALTALLYAIADRGPLYAYLLAAQETLQASELRIQQDHGLTTIPGERQTRSCVSEIVRWCIESVPAGYEQPLFADDTMDPANAASTLKKDRPFPADATSADEYIDLGEKFLGALQIEGKDKETGRKAWKKLGQMIAARMRVGSSGSEMEEGDMGRSVRSL